MQKFTGQKDLVANQTSKHIDKYRRQQPRFRIDEDDKHTLDDDNDSQ